MNISHTIWDVLFSNVLLLISLQCSKPCKKASSIKEKKIDLLNFLSLPSEYYALKSKFVSQQISCQSYPDIFIYSSPFTGTATNLNKIKPFSFSSFCHSDSSCSHFTTLVDPVWVKMSLRQELVLGSKLLC